MIRNWLVNNRNHPVLVVKYEELKQNTLQEVLRMLNFLKVPYSKDMVVEKLTAGFNSFQRSHHEDDFDHYIPEQRNFVRKVVISTNKLLEENHLSHLQSYLHD